MVKNPPANAGDTGLIPGPGRSGMSQSNYARFSRQEYGSGLPYPPGDLSDPGIELMSLMSPTLVGRFFTTSTTWEDLTVPMCHNYCQQHSQRLKNGKSLAPETILKISNSAKIPVTEFVSLLLY